MDKRPGDGQNAKMTAKRKPSAEHYAMDEPVRASYDHDVYGWANEQSALLRAGKFSVADIGNIAEEIESLGKSQKSELVSRLTVLLLHLLKWQFQPGHQCRSWQLSIREQRRKVTRHLAENPSLKGKLPAVLADAYLSARAEAENQTCQKCSEVLHDWIPTWRMT